MFVIVGQSNPDIPVYQVCHQDLKDKGATKNIHRNLLLSLALPLEESTSQPETPLRSGKTNHQVERLAPQNEDESDSEEESLGFRVELPALHENQPMPHVDSTHESEVADGLHQVSVSENNTERNETHENVGRGPEDPWPNCSASEADSEDNTEQDNFPEEDAHSSPSLRRTGRVRRPPEFFGHNVGFMGLRARMKDWSETAQMLLKLAYSLPKQRDLIFTLLWDVIPN